MANGKLPFPGLLEAGRRGAQPLQQPSLFDQVTPGLFSGSSNIRFDETQGGRFKKHFFGGLFGPTKKEREANAREVKAEKAAIKTRATGIAGQIRTAGREDALRFPAVRDAVQLAATGDEEALRTVAGVIGNPTEAQRAAGVERQRISDAQAQIALEDAQLAQEGGRFGTNLDSQQFLDIGEKVGSQMAGASSLFNIADTLESLTDLQMVALGEGTGGDIQGELRAELFALMRPMQTLLEAGKGSVLRDSDRKIIQGVLDNPDEFVNLVFSRESKSLATLRRLGGLLNESAQRTVSLLDPKTQGLLAPVNKITPSKFARPDGPTVAAGETIPEARERAERAAASIPSIEQIQGTVLSGPRGPAIQKIEETLESIPGELKGTLDDLIKRFQENAPILK